MPFTDAILSSLPDLPAFGAPRFRVEAYSPDWSSRRYLPNSSVLQAEWYLELAGGFGAFTLEVGVASGGYWDVSPGDRIEIYHDNVCRYRGRVLECPLMPSSKPAKRRVSGVGEFFFTVGNHTVFKDFAYPGGADLREPFAEIAYLFAQQDGLVVKNYDTGATTDYEAHFGQSVKDAYDQMVERSAGLACYGCYVDENILDENSNPARPDLLLVTAVGDGADPDHVLTSPSTRTGPLNTEEDGSYIYNEATLSGGDPPFPNLLPNALWAQPISGGAGIGNLFANYSFESYDSFAGYGTGINLWSVSGGAIGKDSSGKEGSAQSGRIMIETDNAGEKFGHVNTSPDIAPVPGKQYAVSIWHRAENSTVTSALCELKFWWLDSSNARITGSGSGALDVQFIVSRAQWQIEVFQSTCPSGATGVEIEVSAVSGVSSNNGVLWDVAGCYESSGRFQRDWELNTYGSSATWAASDWNLWDKDKGCGIVYAKSDGFVDANGEDGHLQLLGQKHFEVSSGQALRFTIEVRRRLGATGSPKFRVWLESYDEGGARLNPDNTAHWTVVATDDVPSDGSWYVYEVVYNYEQEARQGTAYIAVREDGELEFRRPCVRDAAAWEQLKESGDPSGLQGASEALYDRYFLPDGNFLRTYRVDQLFVDGDAPYEAWQVYGDRHYPGVLSVPNLTTDVDAERYMRAWFTKNSGVAYPVSFTVNDPGQTRYLPGQTVLLEGKDGRNLPTTGTGLVVHRVYEKYAQGLTSRLDLDRPQRDDAWLIADMIERALARRNAGLL